MPTHFAFPLAEFTGVSWAILAGYFVLMFSVGFAVSRGKQNAREYFLAGRSLPTWALAVSIVATTLSAATFIGVPDQVYLGDVSYLSTYLGAFLGVIIVGTLFVPRLYRAGTVTIYGYLRPRFGESGVLAVSCAFLVGRLLASGSRLFLAAVPLTLMLFDTDKPEQHRELLILSIAMIGCIGIFYTVKGGIRAVVWTDAIQLLLVIGTAIVTIVVLSNRIPLSAGQIVDSIRDVKPGPPPGVVSPASDKPVDAAIKPVDASAKPSKPADSAARQNVDKLKVVDTSWDWSKSYTIWACILGLVWLNMANYGVDHDFAQRFLISKSATRGALSVIGSQLITVLVVMLFMVVGILLWVFYNQSLMGSSYVGYTPGGKLDPAYPKFLLREMPPVLAGLGIAGFFAIAQGSMDSAINAMASSAVADVYYPLRRRFGRPVDETRETATPKIAVAIIGAVMICFAIGLAFLYDPANQTLLDFVLGIMTFAFTGMLGVFLTALFTARGNTASCIGALIAGAATIALLQDRALAWWTTALFGAPFKLAFSWWMPIGTAVAFAVCFAGKPRDEKTGRDPLAAT
jgi:SSS family transporter